MNRDFKKTDYFFTGMMGAITIRLTTPYINESIGSAGQSPKHNKVNQDTLTPHKPKDVSDLQNMIEGAKEVVVVVINYQKKCRSIYYASTIRRSWFKVRDHI